MAAAASLKARYDETPYRDQSSAHFDSSRLLGLGRLFQAESPPDPEKLRVLDLGCASGIHLRSQAARYPDVCFTGVDFSEREVAMGRSAIREASPKSWTWTILGWFSRATAWASRLNRCTKFGSVVWYEGSTLTATCRFSWGSRARKTLAIPPRPIHSTSL